MPAYLSPSPKLRFYGRDGKPLSGGYLFTYDYVTSTPVSTFADADMSTRNPVQIQLDANGEPSNNGQPVSIFLIKNKRYKFSWYDSEGNFIDKVEPVQCPGGDSEGGVGGSIYEIAMFDLSQAGHGLYDDIDANLRASLLPIIYTGSQGAVRYYYYTARDSQAHTMTFTCGHNCIVELLVLHDDDTYEFVPTALDARLPIVIDDGVITNNGTGLTVFGDNSWSEGAGVDENYVAVVVGNVLIDNVIKLDYAGRIRAGDKLRISDKTLNVVSVNYTSNTITVAPGLNVSGGEEVYICGGSLGKASHTEGCATKTTGKYSHAEGYRSKSFGYYSHAEGYDTRAYSDAAHVEGCAVVAQGPYSHAEGYGSTDYLGVAQDCTESTIVEVTYIGSDVTIGTRVDDGNGIYSIVAIDEDTPSVTLSSPVTLHTGDRLYTMTGAFGSYSHAEGEKTISAGTGSHSEGIYTVASESGAHAEGRESRASNYSSHAEGDRCEASGINAHAEGHQSVASNYSSHAEGESVSSGYYSHSEGCSTASGQCSHAEGDECVAYGQDSHAEGFDTSSMGYSAHSEGYSTFAFGYACHAEGRGSVLWTGNTVLDNGSYERSIVHLDSVYGISPGNYICFDYDYDSSSNEWIEVVSIDDQTGEIELNGTTTAPYGAEACIAKGVASDDGAHSEGVNCSAIGYGAHCGGDDSTARGYCAFAHGSMCSVDADYGIAIGKYNTVEAESGIAIGSTCAVREDYGVAVGYYSSVKNGAVDGVAVGYSASSISAYSLAIGANAQSFGGSSSAVGYYAKAYGNLSLAMNTGRAFGVHSVCIGDSGSYVSSTWAVADNYGDNVIIVDDASGILVGDVIAINDEIFATVTVITGNRITIDKSFDVYEYDDVYIYKTGSIGEYSVHIGSDCSAVGDYSVCIGEGLAMRKDYGVAFGKYNVDDNAIFVVGNGTDENSHADCFKIDANGKLMFMHNGNLTDLSTLLNTHNIT